MVTMSRHGYDQVSDVITCSRQNTELVNGFTSERGKSGDVCLVMSSYTARHQVERSPAKRYVKLIHGVTCPDQALPVVMSSDLGRSPVIDRLVRMFTRYRLHTVTP